MKNLYRYTRSPKTIRRSRVQLDNISLAPASLLPDLRAYQALTDRQPRGTAVMVLPSPTSPLRRVYTAVARVLSDDGKNVHLYRAA